MIRVDMFMREADNGYTFDFHAYDPNGGIPFPVKGGDTTNSMHRKVCVEGKGITSIQRLEPLIGVLLQEFFDVIKQDKKRIFDAKTEEKV